VYLNGAILGMTRAEIRRKFDEIIAFAEIEKFIDTPVKRYSSGMYVRLAFAVAAHLEPEILLVDEVLAVGDASFQKKCLGKMGDIQRDGRTILFVSHNMSAVRTLCSRGILLDDGRVQVEGEISSVIDVYLSSTLDSQTAEVGFGSADNDPDCPFQLHRMRTVAQDETTRREFGSNEPVIVEFEFTLSEHINDLKVGFEVTDSTGALVFQTFSNDVAERLPRQPTSMRRYRLCCTIPSGLLNGGRHFLTPCIGVHRRDWMFKDVAGPSIDIVFDVPNPGIVIGRRPGVVAPQLEWSLAGAKTSLID
jgi:lipopolysaccharide transport system ATP-binding protein